MEYRFKDGVRVYNDGISKEGYIVDCTVPENETYNLLLVKAQKLGYKNIAQAIGDKQFLEYKRKLNAKSKQTHTRTL